MIGLIKARSKVVFIAIALLLLFGGVVFASSQYQGSINGKAYTLQTNKRRNNNWGDQVQGRNNIHWWQTVELQKAHVRGFNGHLGWHKIGDHYVDDTNAT